MSMIDLACKNLLANSFRNFSKKDLEETAIRNVENFADKRDEVLPLSSILLIIVRVQFSLSRKSICCFLSPCFGEYFYQSGFFSIVLYLPQKKNQHFQIPIRSGIKDHPGHIKWSLRVTVEYDYGDIFSSSELVHYTSVNYKKYLGILICNVTKDQDI